MQAYIFEPYFKSVIWGGDKIAALKHVDTDQTNIGESWELSAVPGHSSIVANGPEKGQSLDALVLKYGPELLGKHVHERYGNLFPLLVKIIDAKRDLSVQVHPDDALAKVRHNSLGKTEMWYILDTEPGAKIYAGMAQEITPDDYTRLVAQDKIMDVVAAHDSKPGDVFFLPAGRIHAIGAGNLLAEIQETSDITYRVYDYGRIDTNGKPRQLHTQEAKGAIDYKVYPDYLTHYDRQAQGVVPLISCDHFKIEKITVKGSQAVAMPQDSFLIIMVLDGECAIAVDGHDAIAMKRGTTMLVPAACRQVTASGTATMLTAQA